MLSAAAPDILGISEIGSRSDAIEVQSRLKDTGIDLPYLYHTGGQDPVRHLAIMSSFPIIAVGKPKLRLGLQNLSMQRGILDVTLEIGTEPVRFIGLHLKSKRQSAETDQRYLRIAEAQHVRSHLDKILSADPNTYLLLYGDLNDTRRSQSTAALFGKFRSDMYLTPLSIADSRNASWTYHWSQDDAYTRIDFAAASRGLKPFYTKDKSRIIDLPFWEDASDHRPLSFHFR